MKNDPKEITKTLSRIKLKNLLKNVDDEVRELKQSVTAEIDHFSQEVNERISLEMDSEPEN